ncbi:MAG: OmpA family protein [Candidatus Eisenbacteria bacterium]|uniref:OmpA family protein n=1 Tax=Eiseniibacteriota bacterium TaxID=2212470 RepID=A0A948RVZ4_UNCEI|nr:OmpA family protein [Candidatus Eisenbacteria bacterium]MBU1947711.1 OmpA family protein [Candidatus Eisenbacteria bacterium]MBU2692045.1 OmpA family protein [Candidatus Eisenbacteria bacterium]
MTTRYRRFIGIFASCIFVFSTILVTGCSSKSQTGAGIGAAAGAAAGAIIGHQSGNKTEGAVIGAVAGATVGGLIGRRLDKQEEELAAIAATERTEEGLIVTLSSEKINFEVNSSVVSSHSRGVLVRLANTLKEYPEDIILIAGHTDSDGAAEYNLSLSKMRAQAVADIFIANGIDPATIQVRGYGETQPIESNNTADGKAQNRRVELTITIDESKVPQG